MYYQNWANKSGRVVMYPRWFMGFDWSIGEPMTFKLLQCNEDPHKHNIVVHRGVVVLSYLTATG